MEQSRRKFFEAMSAAALSVPNTTPSWYGGPTGPRHLEPHDRVPVAQIVSVKDFNAQGDGNTDDRTSIQAAIDHVAGEGGGRVYFPNGTYMVEAITLPPPFPEGPALVSGTASRPMPASSAIHA